MLIDMLDEMVKAAKGKPVIIINPSLGKVRRFSVSNPLKLRKGIYLSLILITVTTVYFFPFFPSTSRILLI